MERQLPSSTVSQAQVDHVRTISAPSRHEGLGNALRAAYQQEASVLPDEFQKLLARLDR